MIARVSGGKQKRKAREIREKDAEVKIFPYNGLPIWKFLFRVLFA
ncbi:MAG: hypothetical protein WKF92_06860 [Pyrinomonadaceae bacterium]